MSYKQRITIQAYLSDFVWTYKVYLVALLLIALLAGVFEVSVDYKIKEIIDLMALKDQNNLYSLIGLFILYRFVHHSLYFISRLFDITYKPLILEHIVTDIYHKTVEHSLQWFESHLSGEISNKISDFQNGILDIISYLFTTFTVFATIFISLVFLVQVNVLAALVLCVFILMYIPIISYLLKKQMILQEISVTARQKTIGLINDSIVNILGIKSIGSLITEFRLHLQPAISKWKVSDKNNRKFDAYWVDNADTLMTVTMSAVQVYILAYSYQQGQVTAGEFAFVTIMTLKLHDQLGRLLENILFNINPSIAQIRSSFAFIHASIDVQDKTEATDLKQVQGAIEYQNVSFSYNTRKAVLQNLNIKIRPGEKIGIIGTSGAGKTTLIKCLLRYFDIIEGSIMVDGYDIRELTQASLRQAVSIIPQDITLFHRSIKDNLKLAKSDATDEEIIVACKKAKIHEDIQAMPQGYATVVGERGVKLSGGQRQRVAIARAILKDAPILILDEATSHLDTATEHLIQTSMRDILKCQRTTVIAIAHRLSTVKHMDRLIVLDQGKIVETGSHTQLLQKRDSLYKKLWDMQVI